MMEEQGVFLAKVQRFYRLTIPKPVREAMEVQEGEILNVKVTRRKKP